MLTVDDYGAIRRARRDGMSIRQIARTFHHTRRKIRQVLADPEPRPYSRTIERPAPVLGPFHTVIDQILNDDKEAPPKQGAPHGVGPPRGGPPRGHSASSQ